MIKLTSIVFASLVVASVASAEPVQCTATLAEPVAKSTDVIVDSDLFRCEATTCTLVSAPTNAGSVSTCRKLAHQFGEVTAFGSSRSPFDAEKLTRCNAK